MSSKALSSGLSKPNANGRASNKPSLSYAAARNHLQRRGLGDFQTLNPDSVDFPVLNEAKMTGRERQINRRAREGVLATKLTTAISGLGIQEEYRLANFADAHGLASRVRMDRRMVQANRLLQNDDLRAIQVVSAVDIAALASEGAKAIFAAAVNRIIDIGNRDLIPEEEESLGRRFIKAKVL